MPMYSYAEAHKKILLDVMIDCFIKEKKKELRINAHLTNGMSLLIANYTKCLNKKWENADLFWEDYETYFSDIPIEPPDCR